MNSLVPGRGPWAILWPRLRRFPCAGLSRYAGRLEPLWGLRGFESLRRNSGGWGGIRTLGTLLEFTRFPGEPVRPLRHPSVPERENLSGNRSDCKRKRLLKRTPGASPSDCNFESTRNRAGVAAAELCAVGEACERRGNGTPPPRSRLSPTSHRLVATVLRLPPRQPRRLSFWPVCRGCIPWQTTVTAGCGDSLVGKGACGARRPRPPEPEEIGEIVGVLI